MTKRHPTRRDYPRTARLNELFHQIVAEELERIDDERLDLVTVMAVEVDADLHHATVLWADPTDGERDDEVGAAFADARRRLQRAIARQSRTKRTPELHFRPDDTTRSASRIEGILRDLHRDEDEDPTPGAAGSGIADGG